MFYYLTLLQDHLSLLQIAALLLSIPASVLGIVASWMGIRSLAMARNPAKTDRGSRRRNIQASRARSQDRTAPFKGEGPGIAGAFLSPGCLE